MDKRKSKGANRRVTCGKGRQFHLDSLTKSGGKERKEKRVRERMGKKKKEREAPPSLQIFWRSDRQFLSEQETKSIPTARVTRGYRNWGVSTNSKR